MSSHPPPVPPEQRPRHGSDTDRADVAGHAPPDTPDGNLAEQGQSGNTRQNTTNKGLQKGR